MDKKKYPPPIIRSKRYDEPSQFLPENMLREARRQKNIPNGQIPPICILDPDGDIVRNLLKGGDAEPHPCWACYHSQLYCFIKRGIRFGIIGCAVGASYAVLLAEELFASGCRFLISITSSGQINETEKPPFFVLIEKALRDEGTSYHYLLPSDYSYIDKKLLSMFKGTFDKLGFNVKSGATWTTDAPFRETKTAIEYARTQGILAVEMEAAALYAFAKAREKDVICFAHVTNRMGTVENDFEKGEEEGSKDALDLLTLTAERWMDKTAGGKIRGQLK